MTYDSLLIHTCTKGTSTSTQNSLGESKLTWTYSGDSPCRFSPVTASQRVEFIGLYDDVTFILFLPIDSGYTVNNRVKYEGLNYKINDIRPDSSHHHLTALVSELP